MRHIYFSIKAIIIKDLLDLPTQDDIKDTLTSNHFWIYFQAVAVVPNDNYPLKIP